MIFISYSRLFKNTERLSPQKANVLQSANLHISDFSINKKILLKKILKSRAPGIGLWGISLVTLAQSLYKVPFFFFYFQKRKCPFTKLRLGLSRPYVSSFTIKLSCGKELYTFERSISVVPTKPELSSPFSNALINLYKT